MLASLDRSGVETCAARVCVFGSDRSETEARIARGFFMASVRDGGSAVSLKSTSISTQTIKQYYQPIAQPSRNTGARGVKTHLHLRPIHTGHPLTRAVRDPRRDTPRHTAALRITPRDSPRHIAAHRNVNRNASGREPRAARPRPYSMHWRAGGGARAVGVSSWREEAMSQGRWWRWWFWMEQ